MSPTSSDASTASSAARRTRQVVDAVVYAFAVAGVVFVVGALLGLAVGGGLVTAKYVMFVVGLLAFGYATFQMRPDPPWDTEQTDDGTVTVTRNDQSGTVIGGRDETAFQAAVQRIPPLPWYSLPPDERFPVPFKMFLASLATLAWSFVMETVFGVAV
ncbi:DUF7555 family protein [Halorussus aquaticus]|uniref:Uncharacterized protein n=1 Tax=Halorussus aquaticus TaxID=2953748 RepID=A0ABD5Q742_9EURY|nr:hypothetical protein [Halorussus aquaticus]